MFYSLHQRKVLQNTQAGFNQTWLPKAKHCNTGRGHKEPMFVVLKPGNEFAFLYFLFPFPSLYGFIEWVFSKVPKVTFVVNTRLMDAAVVTSHIGLWTAVLKP